MGLFKKSNKPNKTNNEPDTVSLDGVDVLSIVQSPEFIYKSLGGGKDATFRIVRFVEAYSPSSLRGGLGNTHSAIVCLAKGAKEYEALLTIRDGQIVKSFVDKFYN